MFLSSHIVDRIWDWPNYVLIISTIHLLELFVWRAHSVDRILRLIEVYQFIRKVTFGRIWSLGCCCFVLSAARAPERSGVIPYLSLQFIVVYSFSIVHIRSFEKQYEYMFQRISFERKIPSQASRAGHVSPNTLINPKP